MLYSITGLFSILILFAFMLLCIKLGQWLGKTKPATSGLNLTEGAVFTLMALLVAFTFSSANQRFDLRRSMIVEETNAIGTAYLRLDLFEAADRSLLKKDFLDYISSRIATYEAVPDFEKVNAELNKSKEIQARLWLDAINASKNAGMPAPMLVLPPINSMFDIASTRTAFTHFHPHFMIFTLMIFVALLSALLTGYGMTTKGKSASLHVLAYVLITTITIYIIIDLEYPRLGFIKETKFDEQLIDLKNSMLKDTMKT